MDVGDVYDADLNEDRRRRVLVISPARFNRLAGRAVVVPEQHGSPDDVLDPWRVVVDDTVYAVDHVRSVPAERLLKLIDRAPAAAVNTIRRAMRAIT